MMKKYTVTENNCDVRILSLTLALSLSQYALHTSRSVSERLYRRSLSEFYNLLPDIKLITDLIAFISEIIFLAYDQKL